MNVGRHGSEEGSEDAAVGIPKVLEKMGENL